MKHLNMLVTEVAGYKIVEHLGSGGMGEVYKAYHPQLERVAAIKFLYQKEGAERFRNEAYIQSSVSHPQIARLFDYTVVQNTPCIIMEFIEGSTLDDYLKRKGRLSDAETTSITKQVANVLAFLHQKGIVHRDIKPQNFKVLSDGSIKMLDFGIAKNKYTPKLTQLGFVVGTTEYMAPEQFLQELSPKSDIWSLGVMAYEMLTGYMPFQADNSVELRRKILSGKFTRPCILVPEISPALEQVIEGCLRTGTGSRMSAMEIKKLLSGESGGPSATRLQAIDMALRRMPLYVKVFAGILLILFIVLQMADIRFTSHTTIPPAVNNSRASTDLNTIEVNVPSVDHAQIVFPDGLKQELPYELKGREGERFQFDITAEGYHSKTVDLTITSRRHSYEFTLEKKNQ